MNSSTLTLNTNTITAPAANSAVIKPFTKTIVVSRSTRTLTQKWDMFAVIGLMVSSAVYGVYALTQMTGF